MSETATHVIDVIRGYLPNPSSGTQLRPQDALADLGINSMLVIAIILEIAERLSLNVANLTETAGPPATINEIIILIESLQEHAS